MTRFTTEFQSIAASDINTGHAVAAQPDVMSSLAGVFTISHDTLRVIADLARWSDAFRLAA